MAAPFDGHLDNGRSAIGSVHIDGRGRVPWKKDEPSPDSGQEFDDYYRSDARRLMIFLLRIGATVPEAEDIVQEAMIEVFKKWDRIGKTNPAAYARTVAERKFFASMVRARQESEKLVKAGWATVQPPRELDLTILQETARWYIDVMQQLPYQQKRALAWRVDGIEYREIAEQTGLSEATLRSNVRHAKEKIKDLLKQRRAEFQQVGRGSGGERQGR